MFIYGGRIPSYPRTNDMAKSTKLKLQTYRIGSAKKRGDGLRIGTVRYLPRGVRKENWPEYFDVWLPMLAPSKGLLAWVRSGNSPRPDGAFTAKYTRQLLDDPDSKHTLQLVAQIAKRTKVSIGCYCEDESRCHRSVLFKLIEDAAKWP